MKPLTEATPLNNVFFERTLHFDIDYLSEMIAKHSPVLDNKTPQELATLMRDMDDSGFFDSVIDTAYEDIESLVSRQLALLIIQSINKKEESNGS